MTFAIHDAYGALLVDHRERHGPMSIILGGSTLIQRWRMDEGEP